MKAEIIPQESAEVMAGVPELTETLDGCVETESPLPVLSVGQSLRTAREAKGLTVSEVSKILKLSMHQVESLESDDWARLPCNTIIRGFVRNYARLVGLNPVELMAMLDGLQMPKNAELEMSPGTNVSIPKENGAQHRDYLRVVAGFSALVLAVSVYFFLPDQVLESALSMLKSATQSSEATSETVAKKEPETLTPPTATVINETPGAAPQAAAVSPDAPAPAAQTQIPAGVSGKTITPPAQLLPAGSGSLLKFNFSQPSWVEIRDRSGEIIFSQLSQAGTQREVEGRPPFALVIGNATHVTLQYKGKAIDLSKRSKDDVARVTVE
ncbi:MAG: RodZ domain-containing protein [Betaproteobacteria bacterium]